MCIETRSWSVFSQILVFRDKRGTQQDLLGDHSVMDPPEPMPNSVVKRNSADGSVGLPHVRVGHRQASNSFSSFYEKDEGKKNEKALT